MNGISYCKKVFNLNNFYISVCLKVVALAFYYDVNRAYTDLNYRYAMGYSYMLGWLSFSVLIVAITLSVLSRKNEEHV